MTMTKEIMSTKLISIRPTDSMLDAYKIMKNKSIRHLPVYDGEKLVGMLSDRDVQRAMTVHHYAELQQEVTLSSDRKVMDYMNWPVITVNEKTNLKKVVEEILSQKVSAFIVEDDEGKYKGIITTNDLLCYLLTLLNEEDRLGSMPINFLFTSNTLY